MKTLERADGNWLDRLLNLWPFCLHVESIRSIAVAVGVKEGGEWCWWPRWQGNKSLFYNAVFFIRLSLPLGIFWSVRWSESDSAKALLQSSFGWKLNGRITFGVAWALGIPLAYFFGWSWWYLLGLFAYRIQSDASSAKGTSGPNLGQATGFNPGTH